MRIYDRVEQRVAMPGDSETRRSQKTLSMLLMFTGSLFTLVNVASYWSLGITAAGLSYLSVVIFVLSSVILVLFLPRLWQPVGYMAIIVIMALNLAAHIFAGGYQSGLEAIIWVMLGPIAARLKVSKETIADAYDEVTVLFADMVGSTPLFADLEPAEAVDWLNEVFSMFDQLVELYGLEKIRTIGDNYMVAAGVPLPRADHARAIANFALDMQSGLEEIPARGGKKMAFRVGINTGSLVAGVIGRSKYQYDLWGDTVNLASRMESHSEPGKVHVSASTYALINVNFDCLSRGNIPIKGKGEMETWYISKPRRFSETCEVSIHHN